MSPIKNISRNIIVYGVIIGDFGTCDPKRCLLQSCFGVSICGSILPHQSHLSALLVTIDGGCEFLRLGDFIWRPFLTLSCRGHDNQNTEFKMAVLFNLAPIWEINGMAPCMEAMIFRKI